MVLLSTQSRPYVPGWSLLLLACVVAGSTLRIRVALTGVLFGLAVASRIDLMLAFPLVLWFLARTTRPFTVGEALTAAIAGIVSFLVAAPWYLPHLLGNLRYIVSVRLLDPAAHTLTFEQILGGLWREGIGGATVIVSLGAVVALRRLSWRHSLVALYVAALLVSVLQPSAFGLRHQGAFIVTMIALLPWAMSVLLGNIARPARAAAAVVLLLVVLGPPAYQTVYRIAETREASVDAPWVEWVERNAPLGAAIYVPESWRIPLPTLESATALWHQVADPDAWQTKMRAGFTRFGIAADALPHAMSEEQLYQERAYRRRYFILGQERYPARPRFAVTPYSDGSSFDITHEQSVEAFCKSGGVYVARGVWPARLGTPTMAWGAPTGIALYARTGPSC